MAFTLTGHVEITACEHVAEDWRFFGGRCAVRTIVGGILNRVIRAIVLHVVIIVTALS